MASPISMTDEEHNRAAKMMVAVLDLLSANAALADGKLDEETNTRLLDRSKETWGRLDVSFALDLADRLGEEKLRKVVDGITPPSARTSVDALFKNDGGVLPALKNRIMRLNAGAGVTLPAAVITSNDFGCALGALGVVAGVAGNSILGGITAVAGVLMMAECC
uniref:hypothetical protein n=1 Tax=Cupriavidus necator TaxID=106590 RepID=UPI003F490F36